MLPVIKKIAYFPFSVASGDKVIHFSEKCTPLIPEKFRAGNVAFVMVENMAKLALNL